MRTHTKRHLQNRPGSQHLWGFDNGQIASAVPDGEGSRLWALTLHDGSGSGRRREMSNGEVRPALTPVDVRRILRQIEALR
jgi:hypothetical protein